MKSSPDLKKKGQKQSNAGKWPRMMQESSDTCVKMYELLRRVWRVCVCARARSVSVCVRACVCACVCVSVCEQTAAAVVRKPGQLGSCKEKGMSSLQSPIRDKQRCCCCCCRRQRRHCLSRISNEGVGREGGQRRREVNEHAECVSGENAVIRSQWRATGQMCLPSQSAFNQR